MDWRKVIEAAKFFYGDEWWRFIAELKTMHHESERKAIEKLLKDTKRQRIEAPRN